MWIATEINLHHDTAIKEAFNRQLAAKNRKIFWDMNPEHPKAPIYENYLDVYDQKAKDGTLKGGYNYAHFTIFENVNITKERLEEIVSQYDENSMVKLSRMQMKKLSQPERHSRLQPRKLQRPAKHSRLQPRKLQRPAKHSRQLYRKSLILQNRLTQRSSSL